MLIPVSSFGESLRQVFYLAEADLTHLPVSWLTDSQIEQAYFFTVP